jgi:lipopolysaccharide transport system permease protein
MKEMLLGVWAYRHFVLSSIRNDLRARFVRSKLGAIWMIVHPLMQVLIFAIILSEVLSAKLPGIDSKYAFALYLMAGILCWTLFAETVSRCLTLFIDSASLLKKMAFPRITLPLIVAGGMLVNNVLLMLAIFAVFAAMGHVPGSQVLWLPVLVVLTLFFAISIGLLLGVINVFIRDVGQIVPVVLQAMFWLTPIVYSVSILPERLQPIFQLNPLYPLVASYQNVLLFDQPPLWGRLGIIAIIVLGLAIVALSMFRRASPEMVDAL